MWSLGQNLDQIRSNVVKKTQKLVFQWVFIHLKARSSAYKVSEWELRAKLARSTMFEGNQD